MEGCCAHLTVYYTTQNRGNITHGWWQCGDCGTKFQPIPAPLSAGSGWPIPSGGTTCEPSQLGVIGIM